MSDIVKLSASKIKTAQQCSWTYWCKYELKLPDTSNDGASRGTVCHNIFELLGDEHKREFNKIIKDGTIWNTKIVAGQVRSEAKELGVNDEENLELIDEMIVNGLRCDFFGDEKEKPTKATSEEFFDLEINEGDKRYSIRGYIDKLFVYKDNSVVIRDFKSSKQVFKGKDITDNLQNLIYCLAVKHLIPKSKPQAEFIFLRFDLEKDLFDKRGKGFMKMDKITKSELEGFEYQLTEFTKYLENYDYQKATCNYAARQDFPKDGTFGGPLACGKDGYKMSYGKPVKDKLGKKIKAYICPFRKPMTYYALLDKNDKVIKTKSKDEKDLLKADKSKDEKIKRMQYKGCPHWENKTKLDFFL